MVCYSLENELKLVKNGLFLSLTVTEISIIKTYCWKFICEDNINLVFWFYGENFHFSTQNRISFGDQWLLPEVFLVSCELNCEICSCSYVKSLHTTACWVHYLGGIVPVRKTITVEARGRLLMLGICKTWTICVYICPFRCNFFSPAYGFIILFTFFLLLNLSGFGQELWNTTIGTWSVADQPSPLKTLMGI